MSGQPAARIGDTIACAVPQTTPAALPHAPPPGLPIVPPGAIKVVIGGQPAARMGDQSICVGPAPLPNPILKGAFPVPIVGMPAARLTDQGTHPGSVIMPPCCPTVLIGLSGTTGNPRVGNQQCQNLAAGRSPAAGSTDPAGNPLQANTAGQSYNNCGVESARQLINQANGSNISQETLFNQSIASGNATQPAIGSTSSGTVVTAANQAWMSGGTNANGRVAILAANGVPASTLPTTAAGPQVADLGVSLSNGRGAIAAIDTNGMPGWGTQSGPHAIVVTGMEYDDNGNITKVTYNDTGVGQCNVTVTAAQFQTALNGRTAMASANGQGPVPFVVTNNPFW
jgi:uncharacterized Zn-binding protein involved in type VI secretion